VSAGSHLRGVLPLQRHAGDRVRGRHGQRPPHCHGGAVATVRRTPETVCIFSKKSHFDFFLHLVTSSMESWNGQLAPHYHGGALATVRRTPAYLYMIFWRTFQPFNLSTFVGTMPLRHDCHRVRGRHGTRAPHCHGTAVAALQIPPHSTASIAGNPPPRHFPLAHAPWNGQGLSAKAVN
jgi:hypothetical protein